MTKDLKYYLNLPYSTILEFEPGDNTWVAYCPELGRGSCYAIGETKQEALDLLEEAKADILKYALDEGKEIPEPKFEEEELPSGQFLSRIPRSLHQKLKLIADKEHISLNQLVLSYISEKVGEEEAYSKLDNVLNKSVQSLYKCLNEFELFRVPQKFWHFNLPITESSPSDVLDIIKQQHILGQLNVNEKNEDPKTDFNFTRKIQRAAVKG